MAGACGGQKTGLDLLTGVTDGWEPLCGFWELKPGAMEGKPVLRTAEPSLAPKVFFKKEFCFLFFLHPFLFKSISIENICL